MNNHVRHLHQSQNYSLKSGFSDDYNFLRMLSFNKFGFFVLSRKPHIYQIEFATRNKDSAIAAGQKVINASIHEKIDYSDCRHDSKLAELYCKNSLYVTGEGEGLIKLPSGLMLIDIVDNEKGSQDITTNSSEEAENFLTALVKKSEVCV